jgi:hypothetical protein
MNRPGNCGTSTEPVSILPRRREATARFDWHQGYPLSARETGSVTVRSRVMKRDLYKRHRCKRSFGESEAMHKSLRLCALSLLLVTLGALGEPLRRHVDLEQPGALERLHRDNPAHFRAVQQILREVPVRKPETVVRWIRTAFDADMASVLRIKTSYPPKARLSFTLDETEYSALVTMRNTEPALMPAR